jgi:hypothetical protein
LVRAILGRIHLMVFAEGGARPVEHVIPFEELDLQRTIDVNTQRGFRFVLRNAPLELYLQEHPDPAPPTAAPPEEWAKLLDSGPKDPTSGFLPLNKLRNA